MAQERDSSDIESDLRQRRKFTPEEAMARMAGPGAMKGASPVSREKQAELAVGSWIDSNVPDAVGALRMVLLRQVAASKPLQDYPDHPLPAIAVSLQRLLRSDQLLADLVREADAEWGRRMDERPHFDRDGTTPSADDPYTLISVRETLAGALALLEK
jgi:hypothetical protein